MTSAKALCGAEKLCQATMALQRMASGDYSEQGMRRLQKQVRQEIGKVLLMLDTPEASDDD